jgi:uncharacterized protein DUF6491
VILTSRNDHLVCDIGIIIKGLIMKLSLLLLIATMLLSGCASSNLTMLEKNSAYAEYIKTENLKELDEIIAFEFYGWQSLTADYLIIESARQNKFLLAVNGFCNDLIYKPTLHVNQAKLSTLRARVDSVSVNRYEKCFIKSIYKVTKAQVKEISAIGTTMTKKTEETKTAS